MIHKPSLELYVKERILYIVYLYMYMNNVSFVLFCLSQILDTSVSLGKGQKRKAGQLNKSITIGSSAILYTQNTVSAGTLKRFHDFQPTTDRELHWLNHVWWQRKQWGGGGLSGRCNIIYKQGRLLQEAFPESIRNVYCCTIQRMHACVYNYSTSTVSSLPL